jgi:hypothetical protein
MNTAIPKQLRAPLWFALVVCLVVALGAQELFRSLALVGARLVYGAGQPPAWYHSDSAIVLVSALVNRLICYAAGGYVGAFLVRPPSKGATVLLIVVGVIGSIFEGLPWSSRYSVWLLWSVLAPLGVYVGVAAAKWQVRRA